MPSIRRPERWFGGVFKLDDVRQVLGFLVASAVGAAMAATGVALAKTLGEPAEEARYRARFADVIRTLAGNFEPDDRLRSSLLAALDPTAAR